MVSLGFETGGRGKVGTDKTTELCPSYPSFKRLKTTILIDRGYEFSSNCRKIFDLAQKKKFKIFKIRKYKAE